MKILLSTGLTYPFFSVEGAATLSKRLGYDGIEYMMPPLCRSNHEEERPNLAEITGIEVVHAPFTWPLYSHYRESIDLAVQTAKRANATKVNVHPPATRWFNGGQRALGRAVKDIRATQDSEGIEIAVEVLSRPRGNFRQWFKGWIQQPFEHPKDWVRYIEDFDLSPCIDTTHLGTWNLIPLGFLKQLGNRTSHIHLSDYREETDTEHVVPGQGNLRLGEFLKEANQLCPMATITVELAAAATSAQAQTAAARSLAFVKEALA